MNFLIDTNVISEVRKGDRCDVNVAAWYALVNDESLFLSVLVVGEIRKGVERILATDARRAGALDAWLTTLRTTFADRVLPVDSDVALEWGRMSARRPVAVVDGLLAATAIVHDLTLVTRNTADIADLGAAFLNPFESRRRRR